MKTFVSIVLFVINTAGTLYVKCDFQVVSVSCCHLL